MRWCNRVGKCSLDAHVPLLRAAVPAVTQRHGRLVLAALLPHEALLRLAGGPAVDVVGAGLAFASHRENKEEKILVIGDW
jgi:hypothetical protein